MKQADTKAIELVEAIELLRKAGWTVEAPATKGGAATRRTSKKRVGRPPKKRVGRPAKKRVGRPPKNGRRKRGRPPKEA
jgi:hypothetical protein